MQYICLIYSTDGTGPQPGTPEFGPFIKSYMDFTETAKADGKFVAGDALQSVSTATTVSVRGGKIETMDGPFAETKEQLGVCSGWGQNDTLRLGVIDFSTCIHL